MTQTKTPKGQLDATLVDTTSTQTLSAKTLTAPVLGVATATSINFGGTALAYYAEGTWTPTGNGVTLTNNATARYTRIGRLLAVSFDISFPSNTNTTAAQIAGLPFTVGGQSGADIAYQTYTTALTLSANSGGTTLYFYTVGGSQPTNQTLTTARFIGSCIYSI